MKKVIFFLGVLFFSYTTANAQIVVSIGEQPTIYAGVDNHIDFALKGMASSGIAIKSDLGQIIRDEEGGLTWRICDKTKEQAMLYALKGNTIFDSIAVRVKELPAPQLLVYYGHSVGGNKLHNARGVIANPETDQDVKYVVKSMNVTVISNGKEKTTKNISGKFSAETTELLKNVKDGDRVRIDNAVIQFGCETKDRTLEAKLEFEQKNGRPVPVS